jgi:hypothetical protein
MFFFYLLMDESSNGIPSSFHFQFNR